MHKRLARKRWKKSPSHINEQIFSAVSRSATTSVRSYIVNVEDALLHDKLSRFFRHVSINLYPISISIILRLSGDAPANSNQNIYDIFPVEFLSNFSEPTDATWKNRSCSYDSNSEVLQNFKIDITTVY